MTAADPQRGFRFRLVHADGRQEQMLVDAERALIGSASHCEVRLPREIAAHEHVEVFAHEGAVQFAARPHALLSLPVLDGVATAEGRWQAGSSLRIGDVQLYVELVSLAMAKAKPPVWALLLAIPAIMVSVAGVALARPADRSLSSIPEAPALFSGTEAKCPELAPEQRSVLAAEKLRVALTKRERSPFAPQDAFEAVTLFEVSAACFRAAGQPRQAKEPADNARVLREKLDEDYRLRRLRLEHAYRTHQTGAVKRELAVLVPMTSHRRGPYTEWLAALNRVATMELEQRGRLAP